MPCCVYVSLKPSLPDTRCPALSFLKASGPTSCFCLCSCSLIRAFLCPMELQASSHLLFVLKPQHAFKTGSSQQPFVTLVVPSLDGALGHCARASFSCFASRGWRLRCSRYGACHAGQRFRNHWSCVESRQLLFEAEGEAASRPAAGDFCGILCVRRNRLAISFVSFLMECGRLESELLLDEVSLLAHPLLLKIENSRTKDSKVCQSTVSGS